jgi:hypothetical protein
MFYGLIKGYFFGMKTSTGIIDYYLKGCMEGGILKNTLSGSNVVLLPPWLPKKWAVRPTID